jgi:type I restriction enzyme S subunit
MSFPKYPKYKESAELGLIPETWRIAPVLSIAKIINGFPFDSTLFDRFEGAPLVRIRDLNQEETETRYRGEFLAAAAITSSDLLIGMDGDFNVGRWKGDGEALLNQRMCCVRGRTIIQTRFLEYALPAPLTQINAVTYSTTVNHLASSQVAKIRIALPPSDEETSQIVEVLDRETAKIDALVAEQGRLIELLEEKRQAVISHAVTKGLHPEFPMKDSGVKWLGEMPAHWEVWKVSHAFGAIGSGTTPPSAERKWYDDGSIPWVTTSELRENLINHTLQSVTASAVKAFPALRLHPRGSLVVAMYGATIGRLGVLAVDATTNQACCVLSEPRTLTVSFVYYWLLAFRSELVELYATGGGQPNINQQTISALRIPAPELVEQRDIAAFLDCETAKIDTLVKEARSVITLLRERRSALISAAVTGQIDVRQLEAA